MKSTITLLFALLLSAVTIIAQPLNKATAKVMLETAEEQMQKQDPYQALVWYDKYYDETKDKAINRERAYLHKELRDYKKAVSAFKSYLNADKKNEFFEDRFDYGRMLKMTGNYEKAKEQLELFLTESQEETKKELAEAELEGVKMAIAWDVKDDDGKEVNGLKITNIKKLNSKYSEYGPTLYGDELYYAGFGEIDEVIEIGPDGAPYVQIFSANKGEKGWKEGKVLNVKINRDDFQTSNPAFSADGEIMFFTRALLKGNKVELSKIYFAERSGGDWGAAKEVLIGFDDLQFIAKEPSVGELFGKEVLFFVSDMEGGEGGQDIWYATKKGTGVYGEPVNLGPQINTPGDEVTPFYRKGTLYFSSDGLPGIGGLDIFSSVWDGQRWSKPANMQKGYNTSLDEQSFFLDEEGINGFFVSNRPGTSSLKARTCCDDIYTIEIPPVTADMVADVFKASDKKALKGVTVDVFEVVNNTPGNINSQENKKSNDFQFGLDKERTYIAVASKEGYEPDTLTFNTLNVTESIVLEKKFYLEKAVPKPVEPAPKPVLEPEYEEITVESNQPIRLSNIYYDFNDDKILPEAEGDLGILLELMNRYPDMIIELSSHTDYRGKDAYNENLSQRRAESATRWLLAKGIASNRIVPKGYGEKQPSSVASNQVAQFPFLQEGWVLTEDFIKALPVEEQREGAHQVNRRTEFKIISGPTSIIIKRIEKVQKEGLAPKVEEAVKDGATTAPKPKGKTKKRPPKKKTKTRGSKKKTKTRGGNNRKSNPSAFNRQSDTVKMVFDKAFVDFGTMKKGEKKEHTFKFTNQGKEDLIIELVSACDCTTLEYSTTPVPPGGSDEIHAIFDSSKMEEGHTIDIDIILANENPDNGYPIIERVSYKFELEKE